MSKTLFKCVLCLLRYDAFVFQISFSMYLLSILNRFHILIYFFLFCIKSRSSQQNWSFKKVFSKNVLFLQANYINRSNYIKKRLQHMCFLWNLQKNNKGNVQFIFLFNPQKSLVNFCFMKILKNTVTKKVMVCFYILGEENFKK